MTMTKTSEQGWIDQVLAALGGGGGRSLIEFLQRQRWFGGKGKPLTDVRLLDAIELSTGAEPRLLAVLLVEYRGGAQERYLVPLSVKLKTASDEAAAIVELPGSSGLQWVCDATREDEIWRALYGVIGEQREIVGQSGCVMGRVMAGCRQELAGPVHRFKVLSAEQSNTSVVIDQRVIMKLIRKVEMGINPESEILEFLTTQTYCGDVPLLLGILTYDAGVADERDLGTIIVVQRFVPNQGDGWAYTLAYLEEVLGHGRKSVSKHGGDLPKIVREVSGAFMSEVRRLGVITGNLHLALSSNMESEAFRPEPITDQDVDRWCRAMVKYLAEACRDLRALSLDQRTAIGLSLDEVAGLEASCRDRSGDLRLLMNERTTKIRHHGDYHLGQVLKTDEGFIVIDFEGEPARPLEERRAKMCPLRDVAGMLRSFNYAAQTTLKRQQPVSDRDVAIMAEWEAEARKAFLDGYRSSATPGQASFLPASWQDTHRVIQVYELDKALYELRYEMRNRPDWLSIPLQGIRTILR
ncbi:MAG: hypothetical protein U0236_03280 [Nitrospira sp.]